MEFKIVIITVLIGIGIIAVVVSPKSQVEVGKKILLWIGIVLLMMGAYLAGTL